MKKTIYLKSESEWAKFEYEDISDLKDEFYKRNIQLDNVSFIDNNVRIGNNVIIGSSVIGRGVYIDNNVFIGDGTFIGNHVKILEDSKIFDNIRIGDDTLIGKETFIYDNSYIDEKTIIRDNVTIRRKSFIGHSVRIGYNVIIRDKSFIGAKTIIKSNTQPQTILINASSYPIHYWGDDRIQIGCILFTIQEWKEKYKQIAIDYGYTESQIIEYKSWIDQIEIWHKQGKFSPIKLN